MSFYLPIYLALIAHCNYTQHNKDRDDDVCCLFASLWAHFLSLSNRPSPSFCRLSASRHPSKTIDIIWNNHPKARQGCLLGRWQWVELLILKWRKKRERVEIHTRISWAWRSGGSRKTLFQCSGNLENFQILISRMWCLYSLTKTSIYDQSNVVSTYLSIYKMCKSSSTHSRCAVCGWGEKKSGMEKI